MRVLNIVIAASILAGCASIRETSPRFVVATHEIAPIQTPSLFKLDSASGEVWRFSEGKFVEVPKLHVDDFIPEPQRSDEDLKAEKQREAVIEKLNAIRLPEIYFRKTPIGLVAETLTQASVTNGPDKVGIKIKVAEYLQQSLEARRHNDSMPSDDLTPDPFGMTSQNYKEASSMPLVTFSAIDISLQEALSIVCDVAGLKWRVTTDGNVLLVIDFWANDAETRMYDLGPSVEEFLRNKEPDLLDSWHPSTEDAEHWKAFFSNYGVKWPRNSSIRYVPSLGKLIVHNFPDDLVIVEEALVSMYIGPSRPGRYHFTTVQTQSGTLFLVDSISGSVWKYYAAIRSLGDRHTITEESFERIPNHRENISVLEAQ